MSDARRGVTLTRRIKASADKLYDAWTDPAKLGKWWAPRSVELLLCEADVRVGGAWRILMRDRDGHLHDIAGTYLALEPSRELAFTWRSSPGEPPSVVRVTFRADGDETELTLSHAGDVDETTRTARDQGWSRLLRRLSSFLE